MTLEEAKDDLKKHWDDKQGTTCPACTQHVQLYRHSLNSQMASCMVVIHKLDKRGESDNGWVHVLKQVKPTNRMYSLARFWGLIEPRGDSEEGKKTSGYWRLTTKGDNFVLGFETVPKYAHIFNDKVYSHSGESISIRDALGTHFSYDELMGRA